MKLTRLLPFLTAAVVLSSCSFFSPKTTPVQPKPAAQQPPQQKSVTWKTYENAKSGFRIDYPSAVVMTGVGGKCKKAVPFVAVEQINRVLFVPKYTLGQECNPKDDLVAKAKLPPTLDNVVPGTVVYVATAADEAGALEDARSWFGKKCEISGTPVVNGIAKSYTFAPPKDGTAADCMYGQGGKWRFLYNAKTKHVVSIGVKDAGFPLSDGKTSGERMAQSLRLFEPTAKAASSVK